MLTPGSHGLSRPVSPALTDSGSHDAIPDCIMPEDLGELLAGIGADDLDDFGDMDAQQLAIGPPDEDEETWNEGSSMPVTMGFATGGGRKLAPPSTAALAKARKLWDDEEIEAGPSSSQTEHRDFKKPRLDLPVSAGFTTGQGVPVPTPSKASTERAANLFDDFDIPLSTGFQLGSGKAASKPRSESMARALQIFGEVDIPAATPSRLQNQRISQATPSRLPLAVTTNTFSTPKPIQIKTPASSVRRIGLGSTPSQTRVKRAFVTPFKKIVTPAPITISPKRATYEPVFDLSPVPGRCNEKAALLHPQYYSPNELRELNIPNEIWVINLDNAKEYQFVTDDERISERCHSATSAWVENHWSQVLWKIAGQIQAKPVLFENKWTWEEVIKQLEYRYEREYGTAQRPLIRRIQEHDTSASVPMILVVSAIRWSSEEGQEPRPYLELTDGWYRIRAQIDDCLTRAVRKRRIVTGRKIAITGARLESASEGCEVLKAFETSHLVITGNSTSLAKWHKKLGLQDGPFIATLPSLSVDGGLISVMDIIIEKVYPLAYMNGDREAKEAPWNEVEEQLRQDRWNETYLTERSRLEEIMRKELEKLEDVVSLLAQHAEDGEMITGDVPDSIESDLDSLIMAGDASTRIRRLSVQHVMHLAQQAKLRMSQEAQDKQVDVEAELRTLCPPRSVRDFRMIRFSDAQQGVKEPFRAGMLNAWEAKALEDLREGQRYLISNLIPGRSGDWSLGLRKTEVYLHSRRDTRWQLIE